MVTNSEAKMRRQKWQICPLAKHGAPKQKQCFVFDGRTRIFKIFAFSEEGSCTSKKALMFGRLESSATLQHN